MAWDHGLLCAGLHCSPAHTNEQISQRRYYANFKIWLTTASQNPAAESQLHPFFSDFYLCCFVVIFSDISWQFPRCHCTFPQVSGTWMQPTWHRSVESEVPWHVPPTTSNVPRAPNAAIRRSGFGWSNGTYHLSHHCLRIIWIHC